MVQCQRSLFAKLLKYQMLCQRIILEKQKTLGSSPSSDTKIWFVNNLGLLKDEIKDNVIIAYLYQVNSYKLVLYNYFRFVTKMNSTE